jgi:long-subunit acyl-CoA synthetase (AMP-forming)
VLDPDVAAAISAQLNLDGATPAQLAANPSIRSLIDSGVDAGNQKLSRVEQVKRYRILPEFWQPGGQELTPTMKLRRRSIIEKYTGEMERLYDSVASAS